MKDEVSGGLVRRLDTAEVRTAELEDLATETIKAARQGEQRTGDGTENPRTAGKGQRNGTTRSRSERNRSKT